MDKLGIFCCPAMHCYKVKLDDDGLNCSYCNLLYCSPDCMLKCDCTTGIVCERCEDEAEFCLDCESWFCNECHSEDDCDERTRQIQHPRFRRIIKFLMKENEELKNVIKKLKKQEPQGT